MNKRIEEERLILLRYFETNVTEMALIFTSPISSLAPNSSSASGCAAYPSIRLLHKSVALPPKTYIGGRIRSPFVLGDRGLWIVKASSETDGAEPASPDSPTPPSDGEGKNIPIEKLPLESKLQLKLEQKMRMKMAKKIRLRRKRLVRKRHLRKKGRWPPSKLKANKNV
ncbi:50S ribosomal protein 5 alpha, chloroplastic [Andrographis paniculata]|uniref:50S ribosomal protein 5 alpha, chloroplastic n=1 Tax=Andrographis paniculata TaxID=175694 RepID=UPI0021E944B9|nr:50S ribosomal protein 5 alpha, chloroplastic [Andrographis paniculata]